MNIKEAPLFESEGTLAVRLPKSWMKGTRNVTLERQGDTIILKPKAMGLKEVAERCAEMGGIFPDRLPQASTGIRSKG